MAKTNKPEIDLGGAQYDALETHLTQELGLKVFLVRGWSDGGDFENAGVQWQLARTQEAWEAARDKYMAAKDAMLGSLRSNIGGRDKALGDALTEDDLMSLKHLGHVTLRKGSAAQPEAVIIFDPVSLPKRTVMSIGFSDGKGGAMQTVNLTEGGSAEAPQPPPREAALEWAFRSHFSNLWREYDEDRSQRYIPVANFIENFDLDMDDVRRYETLMKVRYALRNQNEYPNLGGRDMPEHVRFAGNTQDGLVDINSPHYKRRFRDVFNDVSMIENRYDAGDTYGFKDPEFFEKIKLAGAVMNLVYSNLAPNNTFARLKERHRLNDQLVQETMRDLNSKLRDKAEEKYPEVLAFVALEDWRVLFPVFREVYEADKSEGYKREYLDTIMQGLQQHFPSLVNAPVPPGLGEAEPPRQRPAPGRARKRPDAPKPAGR